MWAEKWRKERWGKSCGPPSLQPYQVSATSEVDSSPSTIFLLIFSIVHLILVLFLLLKWLLQRIKCGSMARSVTGERSSQSAAYLIPPQDTASHINPELPSRIHQLERLSHIVTRHLLRTLMKPSSLLIKSTKLGSGPKHPAIGALIF